MNYLVSLIIWNIYNLANSTYMLLILILSRFLLWNMKLNIRDKFITIYNLENKLRIL